MPFYAIWKPSDANPRVVALPDLEGDRDALVEIAEACKRGEFRLDRCTCPIHLARSSLGRHFFRHNPSHSGLHARDDWQPKSEEHERLKAAALTAALALGYDAIPEKGEEDWRADALIIGRDGRRLAVEIQLSAQTAADTVTRTRARTKAGVDTLWFFGEKVYAEGLPDEIVRKPFFRLPKNDRIAFVQDMISHYLSDRVVSLAKSPKARFDAQPILFDIDCANCERLYTVVKALVGYPNEVWSDDPGPLVEFLRDDALFKWATDTLRRQMTDLRPYLPNHGGLGDTEKFSCPHCGEPGAPIKLSRENAARVPSGLAPVLSVTRASLALKGPFNVWGPPLPAPSPSPRMQRRDWDRLVRGLMVPTRDKLETVRRERADKARRDREAEALRRAREEARDREKREAIAADRKRIWGIIDGQLRPLLQRDGIEFDLRVWLQSPIPLGLGGGFYPDVQFDLKDAIERRSVRVGTFEQALKDVIAMAEPGGPIAKQLLGLPVERWRDERLKEREEGAAAERRQRFESKLKTQLHGCFAEIYKAHIDRDGRTAADRAAVSEEALRSQLTTVAEMATSLDSESYRRSRLQEAAADRLKYKAAMNWLNARQDRLGSRSPVEACENLAGFDRALAILLQANPVDAEAS